MSFSAALSAINKTISQKNPSFTVRWSGEERGTTKSYSGQGIYIQRDGKIKVNGSGNRIVLEGGAARWEGQADNKTTVNYFPPTQAYILHELIKYIRKMNPNADIDLGVNT